VGPDSEMSRLAPSKPLRLTAEFTSSAVELNCDDTSIAKKPPTKCKAALSRRLFVEPAPTVTKLLREVGVAMKRLPLSWAKHE
jgi:hypothetical protein